MWQRRAIGILVCFAALSGCVRERGQLKNNAETSSKSIDVNKTETTAHLFMRFGKVPAAQSSNSLPIEDVIKANYPYRIALIVKTRTDPFYERMIKVFKDTVKKIGGIPEVIAPEKATDKEQQLELMQAEVDKHVNAICIVPVDSAWIVPAFRTAQEAHIPVIDVYNLIDREVGADEGVIAGGYVVGDNKIGGKMMGQAMINATRHNGEVAILKDSGNVDNTQARIAGFTEVAQTKLTIVATEKTDLNVEHAYQKTKGLLKAYPTIKGIFCTDDIIALGAIKAAAEVKNTRNVAVVGYGNIAAVGDLLESRELYATVDEHPDSMGRDAAKMAVGVLDQILPLQGLVPIVPEAINQKR